MKKILLLAFMACVVTACETMDGFKSGISNSYTQVSNLFTTKSVDETPCPSFVVSNELNNYYDIPSSADSNMSGKLSNAKIERINGNCRLNENNDIVTVSMDIDFTANAGDQSKESTSSNVKLDIPYFIAVLDENEEILAKDTFSIPLELSGVAQDTYHKERLQQNIPLIEGRNPQNYTIITGFQLNEEQLAMAKAQQKLSNIRPAAGNSMVAIPKQPTVMVPVKAIKTPSLDNIPAADPFADR